MRQAILPLVLLFVAAQASATILLDEDIDRPIRADAQWIPSSIFKPGIFTADGTKVVVAFQAQTHGAVVGWLLHAIDNVAVLPRSVYDAHVRQVTQDELIEYDWLHDQPSYPIGLFDHNTVNPADFNFFDRFDSGPNAGWDLTQNAFWVDNVSAPTTDILHPNAATGGSLALGRANDPPVLAKTHILVEGLTPGTEYVLHFWSRALVDKNDQFEPIPDGNLKVIVMSGPEVGVQSSTWTRIKSLYRH